MAARGASASRRNPYLNALKEMNDPSISSSTKDNKKENAHWLLLTWQQVYRAVPHVYMPYTHLDVSITLLSALVLYVIRCIGERTLVYMGWPEGDVVTKEKAGCIVGICHSVTLVPALIVALWTQPYKPSSRMDSHPQWWRDAVVALIQFCTGYMMYDSIASYLVLRWQPDLGRPLLSSTDWIFLGHHFATAFYLTSARIVSAGQISAMICMTIGEFTNPLQNAYSISKAMLKLGVGQESAVASKIHDFIEVSYAALFCLARILVGPIAMLHISYDIFLSRSGRTNIPLWLKILWLVMMLGGLLGSIPWIQECWGTLEKRVMVV